MKIFTKNGRLIIPIVQTGKAKTEKEPGKVKYVVNKVYCPNGCNLIAPEYKINGYPGIRIKFKRINVEGVFVISSIEGDFDKKFLQVS